MKADPQTKAKAVVPPRPHGSGALLQRKWQSKKLALQRKAEPHGNTPEVPSLVHEVLQSPGRPLDGETRSLMEARFGHDFSQVRIHADLRATESARAVQALAYTVGRNVVFASGQYSPRTGDGRRLLAHELTHVLQQRGSTDPIPRNLRVDPSSSAEAEAERVGQLTAADSALIESSKNPENASDRSVEPPSPSLQRQTSTFSAKKTNPKAIIPIFDFVRYVESVERAYQSDTPQEIITRLRLLYYSGMAFDQLLPGAKTKDFVGAAHGMAVMAPRVPQEEKIGKEAFEHLTAHADENATGDNPSPYVKLETGEQLDVGHLLLGLDALIHPVSGEPFKAFDVPAIDPASWVADIGIAAVEAERYEAQRQEALKSSWRVPGMADIIIKLPKSRVEESFKESAPSQDLLGDIDSFGLKKTLFSASGQSLSQAMKIYYLGKTKLAGKGQRYQIFCSTNGLAYKREGSGIVWTFDQKALINKINRFNDLYGAGDAGSVVAAGMAGLFGSSPERKEWRYTPIMLDKFLSWLKPRLETEVTDGSR